MTVGSDKPQLLILITKHWYCIMKLEYNLEQRTIFRQGNHVSPHFTIIIFSYLKNIFVISLKRSVSDLLKFIPMKERIFFSMKNEEIRGHSK